MRNPNQDETAAGFILAGGESSRMGSDKALADFAGRPLIAVAVETLSEAGLSASIAGSRSALAAYAPVIPDNWGADGIRIGPLAGVHAALSRTNADWNVFVTVDCPLLPASFLRFLVERAILTGSPVTVASVNGRLEPFPVILHRNAFGELERALQNGQRACRSAWKAICLSQKQSMQPFAVENLIQCMQLSDPADLPAAYWFRSANTPQDLNWLNQIQRSLRNPIL